MSQQERCSLFDFGTSRAVQPVQGRLQTVVAGAGVGRPDPDAHCNGDGHFAAVGTRQRLLVTGFAKKDPTGKQLAGRTENNRVVNFVGPSELVGGFCEVEITEALPNSMRGVMLAD